MSIDLHMTSFILTNSYLVRERERERAKEGGGDKNTLKKTPSLTMTCLCVPMIAREVVECST